VAGLFQQRLGLSAAMTTSRRPTGLTDLTRAVRLRRWEFLAGTAQVGRHFLAGYQYSFRPAQLAALCRLIDETADVPGTFVELGVFFGHTTLWINKHLADRGRQPTYFAIDTFRGFTDDDVTVERARGRTEAYDDFGLNSQKLYRLTMERNEVGNVTTIEADAATFDYRKVTPVAFALLDVDLYRPMSAALSGLWAQLSPGGIIVCDDCNPGDNKWDGARQAYEEFCAANGVSLEVIETKLGVIRRSR
jgi:predicted O-methyltransferase YrrM